MQLSSVSAPQENLFQVAHAYKSHTDIQCSGAPSFTSSSFKSPSRVRAGCICHSASAVVDGSVCPAEFPLTVLWQPSQTKLLVRSRRSVRDVDTFHWLTVVSITLNVHVEEVLTPYYILRSSAPSTLLDWSTALLIRINMLYLIHALIWTLHQIFNLIIKEFIFNI